MKFIGILSVFVIVAILSSTSQAYSTDEKLVVEIFIESFCKYSKKFITQTFGPVYASVKDKIDVEFYPYGKASRSLNDEDEWEFNCQHGTIECVNNTKQSCALDVIGDNQDRQVEFMRCAMGEKTLTQCSDLLKINKDTVETCASGERGIELQHKAAEESEKVIPKSGKVPTIVFQRIYSEDNSMAAMADFKATCIRLYEENFGKKKGAK